MVFCPCTSCTGYTAGVVQPSSCLHARSPRPPLIPNTFCAAVVNIQFLFSLLKIFPMRIKCVRRSAAMIYPLPAPPVFHFSLSLSVDVLFPLLPDFVLVFGGILFITHWAKIKLTKKKHKIVHCSQREREEGSGIG